MRYAYVYSKPACTQCTMVKNWLTKNGVPFTELDITLPAHMALAEELSISAAPLVVLSGLTPAEVHPELPVRDVPFASREKLPGDAIVFSGFRSDILTDVFLSTKDAA